MCELHGGRARRDRIVASRGYKTKAHTDRFRGGVLSRDPVCVIPGCTEPATVADHYPLTRRQLVARNMDPDDPGNGRGLCWSHHSSHTGSTSPGGWAADR
jgi:5-methylcytosine-specific restriction protein A